MDAAISKVGMLIRRPSAEVFAAFVRPDAITKFWLARTTGPLAKGARVTWEFMVPGASATVSVTDFVENERIAFDWPNGMSVAMDFGRFAESDTQVTVTVSGIEGRDATEKLVDVTEGFSIVLCDLKTLLETGRSANLVRDKAELIANQ